MIISGAAQVLRAQGAPRLPANALVQAGKLALRYDPANVHWFDPQSGLRLS